jgi:hypothetical protein
MSFSGNYECTSFKQEVLEAKHDFRSHTFKLALYDNNASFTASTTDYTTENEISGTGYSAGGAALTLVVPATSGTVAFASFLTLVFSTLTVSGVRGAILYNSTTEGGSGTTEAVCILDFGRDFAKTAENFTVTFPSADSLNAIVRAQ